MIIWGSTGRETTIENGRFHCPRCSAEQSYVRKSVRRYFTLYFIPLIPLGSDGEYIQCRSCAGTFDSKVLKYDPEEDRQEAITRIRRIAILFLLDVGRTSERDLAALQDVVGDLADHDVEAEVLARDLRQARSANACLLDFAKRESRHFNADGKWVVMVAVRQILETGSTLSVAESERLIETGQAMGLRKKHIDEFMNRPLES